MVQAAERTQRGKLPADDIDLFLSGNADADSAAMSEWIVALVARDRVPAASAHGLVDFQLTRGALGLTT